MQLSITIHDTVKYLYASTATSKCLKDIYTKSYR